MFGEGLLDGLEGMPPEYLPYDQTATPWRLIFSNLESHVKQKVRDLLKSHTTKIQPVEPGGYPYNGDALIAEMAPLPPSPPAFPGTILFSPPAPPPSPPGLDDLYGAGAIDNSTRDLVSWRSAHIQEAFQRVHDGFKQSGPTSLFEVPHKVWRHESVTGPWRESLRNPRCGQRRVGY